MVSLAPEGETFLVVRQKPQLKDGQVQLHPDGGVKATWPAFLPNKRMADGQSWYGFFNQDGEMLVGHPEYDSSTYFTDGRYFNNMWDFFSIDSKEFTDAMGRYLKKKYGCEFDKIW